MDSVERYFECNGPGVIFEQFEDETVVINLDSGHYYTLDAVGAAVWQRLTGPASLARVVADLQDEYQGDPGVIESAVREFVGLLLGEQLIRPRAVDAAGFGAAAAQPGANGSATAKGASRTKPAFKAPEMGKYNDMAEMLLLDPVHDVDGAGWPSAPGGSADAPTGSTAAGNTSAALVEDDVSAWPELKRG